MQRVGGDSLARIEKSIEIDAPPEKIWPLVHGIMFPNIMIQLRRLSGLLKTKTKWVQLST